MHCLLGSVYLTCLLALKTALCSLDPCWKFLLLFCYPAFNSIILSTHFQDVLFNPSILSKISFFVSLKKDETTENKDIVTYRFVYAYGDNGMF